MARLELLKIGDVLKFGDILKLTSGSTTLGSILLATKKIGEASKITVPSPANPGTSKTLSPTATGARLLYLGGRPELRQQSVRVGSEGVDVGQATGDTQINRLVIAAIQGAIQIVHVPGHLLLSTLFDKHLTPGETVKFGESIYLKDLSGASMGVMDVGEG